MFSHVTLGTNDVVRAKAFYDAALAPLGMSAEAQDYEDAVAYGVSSGSRFRLWILPPYDGLPATWSNGAHLALVAPDAAAVDAFHAAAMATGGIDEGPPGPRPHYAPDYYAAYVRDPDGNKLQAVHYGDGRTAASADEMVSHVTLGSNDLTRSGAFYDALLAPLGYTRVEDDEGSVAYGAADTQIPWFFTHLPFDGRPATWGNGTHVAFMAPSRAAVDAFHAAGLDNGAQDEGPPGLRPQYTASYYGAYLRDPDGNKLQAVCYAPA